MQIVNVYQGSTLAWYAAVLLDDGSRSELKLRQSARPSDPLITALATQVQDAIAAARLPHYFPISFRLYTRGGQDLSVFTLRQLSSYLTAHPELATEVVGHFLAIPYEFASQLAGGLVLRQRHDELMSLTCAQLLTALTWAISNFPALANAPATQAFELEVSSNAR